MRSYYHHQHYHHLIIPLYTSGGDSESLWQGDAAGMQRRLLHSVMWHHEKQKIGLVVFLSGDTVSSLSTVCSLSSPLLSPTSVFRLSSLFTYQRLGKTQQADVTQTLTISQRNVSAVELT